MRAIYAPMSVGNYCNDLNDNKIIVNDEYQRNAGVWSSYARSFFIVPLSVSNPRLQSGRASAFDSLR